MSYWSDILHPSDTGEVMGEYISYL